MVHEEQVLLHLQNVQLGLRHDVHAVVLRTERVHMESACIFPRAAHAVGNHILSLSGAVFG
jgi:hypothetical protein